MSFEYRPDISNTDNVMYNHTVTRMYNRMENIQRYIESTNIMKKITECLYNSETGKHVIETVGEKAPVCMLNIDHEVKYDENTDTSFDVSEISLITPLLDMLLLVDEAGTIIWHVECGTFSRYEGETFVDSSLGLQAFNTFDYTSSKELNVWLNKLEDTIKADIKRTWNLHTLEGLIDWDAEEFKGLADKL